MRPYHKTLALVVLALVAPLTACHTSEGARYISAPTSETPLHGHSREDSVITGTKEKSCEDSDAGCAADLFPGKKYNFAPADAKSCVLPAAIQVGEVIYPKGVNPTQLETVKVALIVSSGGGVLNSKYVSATDERFVSAALKMANSMKFRPHVCDGTAYDVLVVAPMIFTPRIHNSETGWLGRIL